MAETPVGAGTPIQRAVELGFMPTDDLSNVGEGAVLRVDTDVLLRL